MEKPFTKEEILGRVRGLLDSPLEVPGDGVPVAENIAKAVLVIEDSRPLRAIMAKCLRDAGYTVVEAASCAEGLAGLEAGNISLVLSDLSLGGKSSGLALLQEMASIQPGLECVLMTGSIAAGQELPTSFPVLAKPFAPGALIELVERLAGKPNSQARSDRPPVADGLRWRTC
jgi:DNA-binding NtrC family response regulator